MTNIEFITGAAGTGKSTLIQQRLKERGKDYTKLCATTGVAAANLGTTTLHSLLRVLEPEDFYKKRRKLLQILSDLSTKTITIDEVSMLSASMLDGLVDALDAYNEESPDQLDLILTGDFAQLPPVDSGGFAFEAKCWSRVTITKLEKIWRQDNPQFLEAINFARRGLGSNCARLLKDICEFAQKRDSEYPGLCLVATKKSAHSFNLQNLERLTTDYVTHHSVRWNEQLREWKDIPDSTSLKINCRVRVRANNTKDWNYVNGDTGVLLTARPWTVLVDRTKLAVTVNPVTRYNEVPEPTDNSRTLTFPDPGGDPKTIHYIGSVTYMPLEAGYASTVHSAQGLTLDSAQISLIDLTTFLFNRRNFGHNLAYVALSRVRTPEKLRIHGSPQELASKIRLHPKVSEWI